MTDTKGVACSTGASARVLGCGVRSKAGAPLVIATIVVLFGGSPALAQNSLPQVKAPIGCDANKPDCINDITLAEARQSSEKIAKQFEQCLAAKEKREQENKSRREKDSAAIEPGVLVQAPIFVDNEIRCLVTIDLGPRCSDEVPGAKKVAWASVERVRHGDAELKKLLARATTTNPVNNQIVVEATESKPNEQHLALCDVRTVNAKHGPPENCKTVAIITPSSTFLRAEFTRYEGFSTPPAECLLQATLRVSTGIDIDFEVHTKLDAKKFSDSLYRGLTEQLAFQSAVTMATDDWGKTTSIDIRSTAPLRDSSILGNGWREAIDFDVHLRVKPDVIDVSSYTRPMVCRQAAGQIAEYHGPDDAQRATYARVLNDFVGKALLQACTKARQIDSKQIECE